MRSALFRDVTQFRMIISYRSFGATLSIPSSRVFLESLTLKDGPDRLSRDVGTELPFFFLWHYSSWWNLASSKIVLHFSRSCDLFLQFLTPMIFRLCCFSPVANFRSFSLNVFLWGEVAPRPTPTWRTRLSLFIWPFRHGRPYPKLRYRQHSPCGS
jgi:hypothetical protein